MGFISRPFTTKSSIWAPYLNDQQVLRSSKKGANYELCWTPVLMSVVGMKSQRLQRALSCRYYFPFNILILQETFRNALNPSFILISFDILTLQETLIFALQRNVDWCRQHIIPMKRAQDKEESTNWQWYMEEEIEWHGRRNQGTSWHRQT